MTTTSTTAEDRLARLGIHLTDVPCLLVCTCRRSRPDDLFF